jgi:hypothetical protein
MIYNDPMLPRSVLRGDDLFVGNETDPYFRAPGYVVDFEVTDLQIYGGYEAEDLMRPDGLKEGAKTRPVEGLRGQAILQGRSRFAVVGVQTDIKPRIDFHLLPVLAGESEYHWRANIGFRMNDREFETERGFWIQAYCIRRSFDEILAKVRKGQLRTLRVELATTMWTRQKFSDLARDAMMTLYLVPPVGRRSRKPDIERGVISSLTWGEFSDAKPAPTAVDPPASRRLATIGPPFRAALVALVTISVVFLVLISFRH